MVICRELYKWHYKMMDIMAEMVVHIKAEIARLGDGFNLGECLDHYNNLVLELRVQIMQWVAENYWQL